MRTFWRAVVVAVAIAILVAIVAWATAPTDHVIPPPIVPLSGARPSVVLPIDVNGPDATQPDYTICGKASCPVP